MLEWLLPALFPAHGRQCFGAKAMADAKADRVAHLAKRVGLQAKTTDCGCIGQAHVSREADLHGCDGQHAGLAFRARAETSHHVMDVMGCGNALGQPLGL